MYRDVGIHPGYSASLCVQLSQSCLVPEYMHGSQGLNLSVVAASFLRACSRSLHSRRCSDLVLVLQQSSRSRGSGPHGAGLGEGGPCAGHGSHPRRGRTGPRCCSRSPGPRDTGSCGRVGAWRRPARSVPPRPPGWLCLAPPRVLPVQQRCPAPDGLVVRPGRGQGRVPEAISVSVPDKQMEAALSYYPGAKRERLNDVFSWLISGCPGPQQQQDVFLGWQLWIVSAPRQDQVPGNRSDIRC